MSTINFLSLIKKIFFKKYLSKLRNIIRGRIKLTREGELSKISDLKRNLAKSKLNINQSVFSRYILGNHIKGDLIELSIRQYLLIRIGNHSLNKILLEHIGNKKKIVYPLPMDWINIIENNGFRIAKKLSAILWYFYILLLGGYSLLILIEIILKSIITTIKKPNLDTSYIYFYNLNKQNIPNYKKNLKSYDILTWYIKYSKNKTNFKIIKHDVLGIVNKKIEGIQIIGIKNGPIPLLQGWKKIIIFFVWGLFAMVLALFDLLRGQWWHLFILNQAILAKQVSLSNPEHLAKEYLFHNTNQTYRPLWTYYAEKLGSQVKLYFYSTNVEGYNINPSYQWLCMSWPKYLVWDKYQAKFLKRSLIANQNIEIVKPIWFSDKANLYIPDISKRKIISIFPVSPSRQVHYSYYEDELDYVIPNICIKFLEDILDCAQLLGLKCLLKVKRDLVKEFTHPKYIRFINLLENNPNVILVDSRISPHRVITQSSMVISFPFTGTALIAKELGKPSCYYDPMNSLFQCNHGAHGIQVINNNENLLKWIKSNC
ncbi:polysaccharide biosynthesis PFTS motif protein [Alphaproteobacteria bacterium]|nr:polysaccharide biosynthesis PFTS motif protein [Alphaproteobacteria bacterium]